MSRVSRLLLSLCFMLPDVRMDTSNWLRVVFSYAKTWLKITHYGLAWAYSHYYLLVTSYHDTASLCTYGATVFFSHSGKLRACGCVSIGLKESWSNKTSTRILRLHFFLRWRRGLMSALWFHRWANEFFCIHACGRIATTLKRNQPMAFSLACNKFAVDPAVVKKKKQIEPKTCEMFIFQIPLRFKHLKKASRRLIMAAFQPYYKVQQTQATSLKTVNVPLPGYPTIPVTILTAFLQQVSF